MPATPADPFAILSSPALVQEALKRIAIELIAAHRQARHEVLSAYALKAGLADSQREAAPGKLFMKLIQIYHPDRLQAMLERIQDCRTRNDQIGLSRLAGMLAPDEKRRRDPLAPGLEMEFGFQAGDFGFGERGFGDHLDGDTLRTERRRRQQRPIDFLEALKREYFGNLDLNLSRLELSELDGDLELVDHGIGDLNGIQYCRNLSGLNLSLNAIHDLGPLRGLRRLETLDLSANQLDEADDLENLRRLEELDLSDNLIDDIAFLEELPSLKVANLRGNPVRDKAVLERLRARGVLVIF